MRLKGVLLFWIVLMMALTSVARAVDLSAHDLYDQIMAMRHAYEGVNDYIATFYKQERISGRLLDEEKIELKFQKPFKVYMRWVGKVHKGREALYVQGKNDNKVIGHEGGFLGFITLRMDPKGRLAVRGNRHPITEMGLGYLIETTIHNMEKARKLGLLDLKSLGTRTTYSRPVNTIEIITPAAGFHARRLILEIDRENGLPVRVQIYDPEDYLIEKYGYADLRLNPGLSDEDFSEENKNYNF
jgi:outer membrane lipoprotein-sorting protein